MCLAAPPAAQDHRRCPRRRAWHTVGALAGRPTPPGGTWRDPVAPLPRSPRLRVLAAGRQAFPMREPSLAGPDGTGWCGGRLCEVTTLFPPFLLDFPWICFSLAASLLIRRNTDEAALTKNVRNGAVRVFEKGHLFLKAASRLEALPELPPEALMPPRRPTSEQCPPPVTRPVPHRPRLPCLRCPPGSPPAPSSASARVLVPASASRLVLSVPPAALSPMSGRLLRPAVSRPVKTRSGSGAVQATLAPSRSEAAIGPVTPHGLAARSLCPLPTARFGGWGMVHSGTSGPGAPALLPACP